MEPTRLERADAAGPRRGLYRFFGAALGLCVATGALELGLRAAYASLPSVAALHDASYHVVSVGHPSDPERSCVGVEIRTLETPKLQPGGADLLIGGDSVAAGFGVAIDEAFGARIRKQLSAETGREWRAQSTALPAAGWCLIASRLSSAIPLLKPKLTLIALFADDLQAHEVLLIDGKFAAPTEAVARPMLRSLVRRSYLANQLWFLGLRAGGATGSMHPTPAGVARFRAAMIELDTAARAAGGEALFTLLAPAGMPRCGTGEAAAEICTNIRNELGIIAFNLERAGLPWVDLRELWQNAPPSMLEGESQNPMPVHPDAGGHARIAAALLPYVRTALRLPPGPESHSPP